MSEPADHKKRYLNRMANALARFEAHETLPVALPVLTNVSFDVLETFDELVEDIKGNNVHAKNVKESEADEVEQPDEDEEVEDHDIVFTEYKRGCLMYTYPDKLSRLAIVITDEMLLNRYNLPPLKTMEAKHVWIMDVEAPPDTPVKASSCQIMFDAARGGKLDPKAKADRVPAVTYLGKPVTTNEQLVRMIEALPDSWKTPLDFSTVQ